MKKLAILGSTGSIGKNCLAVARYLGREAVQVIALAAKNQIQLLEEQAREFHPQLVAVYDVEKALELQKKIPHIPVLGGMEGLHAVATAEKANLVISAMSGAIGLAPTIAAITLGIVGASRFDRQFGKNQAFNSAGNVLTAVLIAVVSYELGYRWIFTVAIVLAIPAFLALIEIDGKKIDFARARGAAGTKQSGKHDEKHVQAEGIFALGRDRVLLAFLAASFLFHLSNAAMLPELGELLAKGNPRDPPNRENGRVSGNDCNPSRDLGLAAGASIPR